MQNLEVELKKLYDHDFMFNNVAHKIIFNEVFGQDQYIGQFSDNSADEIGLLINKMDLAPNSRLLDVGCGTGAVANFICSCFNHHITGIDLSGHNIAIGRQHGTHPNLDLQEQEFFSYTPPTLFDGIYGTGAFCHFEAGSLFKKAHKLLAAGGKLGFMERVRLADLNAVEHHNLTTEWSCPAIYSIDEYRGILADNAFHTIHAIDLTKSALTWHNRSVQVRVKNKAEIIRLTNPEYFEKSLTLAKYEQEACYNGKIGYALIVAEKTNGKDC